MYDDLVVIVFLGSLILLALFSFLTTFSSNCTELFDEENELEISLFLDFLTSEWYDGDDSGESKVLFTDFFPIDDDGVIADTIVANKLLPSGSSFPDDDISEFSSSSLAILVFSNTKSSKSSSWS